MSWPRKLGAIGVVAGRCFIRNDSNLLASVNLLKVVLAVLDFQQIQGAQQIGVLKVRVLAKETVGDRHGCRALFHSQ